MSALKTVNVKIISDIVWPFCFVGLRHMEEASKVAKINVNLTWEPFLLNRNTPEKGEDLEEHLVKKYGSRAIQMLNDPDSYLFSAGRKVGIEFLKRRNVYPTVKAHSLMEYVKEQDNNVANDLMEKLFHRYFEKGENINDEELLAEIASSVGIDKEKAKESMAGDNMYSYAVREKDQLYKQEMRVSGVPFFIIDRKDGQRPVGFSGAQPIDIMAEQLEEAAED